MTYLSLTWRPRTYYIMINKTSGKKYVGQTIQDISKYCGSGGYWINHCKKYGGHNKKNVEVLWSQFFICEKSAQMWLDQFALDNPGYDLRSNKEWGNVCLENTEDSALTGAKFQKEAQIKRVADGTHHLLSGDIQRKNSAERIADGTHHLLGPETNQKRLDDQTHNFLKNKGSVPCYDRNGNYVRVPKYIYEQDKKSNTKDSNRQYVHMHSKEVIVRMNNRLNEE